MILLGEDDFADSQWMPAGPFAVDTVVTKNVTLSLMFELRGYIDENGRKRFALWFERLNAIAAAKVTIALTRMERGNHSNAKGVGAGVLEYKIDFGPG